MRVAVICCACLLAVGCAETPAQPRDTTMLAAGTWTGDGCLSVAAREECELLVGCGHGAFPQPVVRADGTFDVDGTYRVEAGPVSSSPAPPAKFSGIVRGQTLTLTVTPSDGSRPVSYMLQLTSSSGRCVTACV
jgi:hypothetical protein